MNCLISLSDWTAVERNAYVPFNLEVTPLQIKTDSTLGSNDKIHVMMYNKGANLLISWVAVAFSSPMKYQLAYCSDSWTDLPVQPPVDVDKIWTITKTENAYIWTCNNVEVLNYLFAESYDSRCVWQGDIVDEIVFHPKRDSASDFFRAGKGVLKARGLRVWYHVSC